MNTEIKKYQPLVPLNGKHHENGGSMQASETEAAAEAYFNDLNQVIEGEGLQTLNIEGDVKTGIEMIDKRLGKKEMMLGLPVDVRQSTDPKVRTAGAFFAQYIKPSLATGRDAYKPTPEDIEDFCRRAANGVGVDVIQYYALSKTQSPNRTGSPDNKIDLAELEMLRYQAVAARVAEAVDLKFRSTIVDETDVIPKDPYFGLTEADEKINRQVSATTLKQFGIDGKVKVRSLRDSVVVPLGGDFAEMYARQYEQSLADTLKALETPEASPLSIRFFTLLDCMPDSGILALGVSQDELKQIRSMTKQDDFTKINSDVFKYLVTNAANIDTIMALRTPAKKAAKEKGIASQFPEYNDDSRVYGGVTRSKNRWSFLPHPTKYFGRVINPMHGLATYTSDGAFYGVAPYNELEQGQREQNSQLVYLDSKPVAARVFNVPAKK